jgi:excinuclease UvrABC nuclease subunit
METANLTSSRNRDGIGFSYVNIMRWAPEAPGIYRFFFGKICLYVGSARDQTLKDRLKQHWRGSHNHRLGIWIKNHGKTITVEFCVVDVRDLERIKELEQSQIQKFSPMLNLINARS